MIVFVPDPRLTAPAKAVERIDKKILRVVREMKTTLVNTKNPKGVGLAAPQIGVLYRIFITRPTQDSPIEVFLNPEIIWMSKEVSEIKRPASTQRGEPEDGKRSIRKDKKLEGCLSIPNIWGYLKRPSKVKLRYMDLTGITHEREFSGFTSTIVQHETDHVNGILFTQRVFEQKEKLYHIEKDEKGEEKLVEVEI